MRVLGLPVQFFSVLIVSVTLVIFVGAWAASARVEARAQQPSAFGTQQPLYGGMTSPIIVSQPLPGGQDDVERDWWESAFLFACPLHGS